MSPRRFTAPIVIEMDELAHQAALTRLFYRSDTKAVVDREE
jgi:hypothetical protein